MATIHIGIAGNIGSGKSTLAEFLERAEFHKQIGLPAIRVFRESVVANPYLGRYYDDSRRWAFESQMSFLQQRIKQQAEIKLFNGVAVEDRTAIEDRWVFAEALHEQGILDDLGFANYLFWYRVVLEKLCIPHLLVYLRIEDPEILLERIAKRGRGIEAGIDAGYLRALGKNYAAFIDRYTAIIDSHLGKPDKAGLLVVDATPDFERDNPRFLEDVARQIKQKLDELGLLHRPERPLTLFEPKDEE